MSGLPTDMGWDGAYSEDDYSNPMTSNSDEHQLMSEEVKDLLLYGKFNIQKGDNIAGRSIVSMPEIAKEIKYYMESQEAERFAEIINNLIKEKQQHE